VQVPANLPAHCGVVGQTDAAGELMTDLGLVAKAPTAGSSMRSASARRTAEFAALYQETFRELSGYCAAMLRDDHLAGDIAQEAFVRLFSRWRTVDNPRGFLFVTATNLVRDEWRRRGRARSLFAALQPLVEEATPTSDVSALDDAILRLPHRERDVMVLHLIADLPLAEVARLTHAPLGTVKRRLHDARKRLRNDWTDES
jgi:RNA polymerase sigma-70 factor (ECF subfamily)